VVLYVERVPGEPVAGLLGINIPFIGVALAIALIYSLGLIVSSLIGKFFLRLIDRTLLHVPVLKELYRAWKQVALTPGGNEGMYAKVVLIPGESTSIQMLGFSSGAPLPDDPN